MEHTPGPWNVRTDSDGGFKQRSIWHTEKLTPARERHHFIVGDCPARHQGMTEANARLIAASPTMFDFLVRLEDGEFLGLGMGHAAMQEAQEILAEVRYGKRGASE